MYLNEKEESKEATKTTASLPSESHAARRNQTRQKLSEVSPFSSGYSEVSPFSRDYSDTSPLQMKAINDPSGPSSPFAHPSGNPYCGTPVSISGNLAGNILQGFGIDTNELSLRESPDVAHMGARATAQGDVIRFAPGEFNPDTHEGLSVLGHELNHVREQASGGVRANVEGTNIHYDAGHEAASDRAGEAFASGGLVGGVGAVGTVSLAGAEGMGVERKDNDTLRETLSDNLPLSSPLTVSSPPKFPLGTRVKATKQGNAASDGSQWEASASNKGYIGRIIIERDFPYRLDSTQSGNASDALGWYREDDLFFDNDLIANDLIVNFGVGRAELNDFHPLVAQSLSDAIKEALEDFPKLRINFIGSINGMISGIFNDLVCYYMKLFENIPNSGWSEKEIYEAAILNADRFINDNKLVQTPGVIAWSLYIPKDADPTGGGLSKYNGVAVNSNYASDNDKFTQILQDNVKIQHFPIGCDTPRATMDHELGHEIDKLVHASSDTVIRRWFNELLRSNDAANQLSSYAQTNVKEFIAECYSEYRNNTAPRDYSRKVFARLRFLND